MEYSKTIVAVVVVPAIWLLFKKLKQSEVADIRGLDTSWSFLMGTPVYVLDTIQTF
jgi:hypothetical protein